MAGRLVSNLAPVPTCRRSRPSQALPSLQSAKKPFLGKCILGICQDHDVKGTSLVLPCTQSHTEFEVALRDFSEGCQG